MAAKPYEVPDLVMIGGGSGDDSGGGSQGIPQNASDLSFPVWKDLIGSKNSSYQDYVAWMNTHGYGAYIHDEEY